jgi:uncharacterized protein Smg (DUF494 family)
MKQSLIKLVDVILKKIDEYPESVQTEGNLRTWLQGEGYNKRDIDAALKLVQPRILQRTSKVERHRPAIRLLSPIEEQKLTPEARDALQRLDVYGMIDGYERELILDRVCSYEDQVGLEELDYVLSWVIGGMRDYESQQTIFRVLDGQRDTLH